jgi:hypothetical protein
MTDNDHEVMAVCLALFFLAIWVGAVLGMSFGTEALPS